MERFHPPGTVKTVREPAGTREKKCDFVHTPATLYLQQGITNMINN